MRISRDLLLQPLCTGCERTAPGFYRYQAGATKLPSHRALDKFPEKTLIYEPDGIMGFKVQHYRAPPYLQVAMSVLQGKVAQVS